MTKQSDEQTLLANIKTNLAELETLLQRASSDWEYDDFVYRFYHHSFKVYGVQRMTASIVEALRKQLPDVPLNADFLAIVEDGTGRSFTPEANQGWLHATRPMIEAFFHARFLLEMAVKAGRTLDEPPQLLPSGWAAVLYLYGLR